MYCESSIDNKQGKLRGRKKIMHLFQVYFYVLLLTTGLLGDLFFFFFYKGLWRFSWWFKLLEICSLNKGIVLHASLCRGKEIEGRAEEYGEAGFLPQYMLHWGKMNLWVWKQWFFSFAGKGKNKHQHRGSW